MKIKKVCILGGSGFVGRHLTLELASRGYQCLLPVRHAHRHRDMQIIRGTQITAIDDFSTASLQQLFHNCDAVINLIGILNASKRTSFQEAHVELPVRIAEAARQAKVKRLLHMSALGANESQGLSRYLRSKGEGENRVHTRCKPQIAITSFRPSVIFGEDDSFINRFHQLMRIPGPLPLACPNARFAPVYIGDLVQAFANALEDDNTFGNAYPLCGPREFTLREIIEYIAHHSQRKKMIIGLNNGLSRLQARMLGMMPGKPFTMDNYHSLQTDSICTEDGLAALGVNATDMDLIVPGMLTND